MSNTKDPATGEDAVLVSKEDVSRLQSANAEAHGGEVQWLLVCNLKSTVRRALLLELRSMQSLLLRILWKLNAAVAQSATAKLHGGQVPKESEAAPSVSCRYS